MPKNPLVNKAVVYSRKIATIVKKDASPIIGNILNWLDKKSANVELLI